MPQEQARTGYCLGGKNGLRQQSRYAKQQQPGGANGREVLVMLPKSKNFSPDLLRRHCAAHPLLPSPSAAPGLSLSASEDAATILTDGHTHPHNRSAEEAAAPAELPRQPHHRLALDTCSSLTHKAHSGDQSRSAGRGRKRRKGCREALIS